MTLNATVLEKITVSRDHFILRVKPDFSIPNYLPGQYVAVGLPGYAGDYADHEGKGPTSSSQSSKLIKRAYSLSSSPENREFLEFYIVLVEQGILTPRIFHYGSGERLYVSPKIVGTFNLSSVPEDSNLIFIATGTGVAPFISMLRTKSTWQPARSISLIHGVRYATDLGFREEMLTLQRNNPAFRYFPVTSRDTEVKDGIRKGYVQQLLKDGSIVLDPHKDHVFLCGNPAMVDEVSVLLTGEGFLVEEKKNGGNLHFEKYW